MGMGEGGEAAKRLGREGVAAEVAGGGEEGT